MADYTALAVAAVNLITKPKLEEEDRHVPGVYSVMVPKGLSDKTMASVALDAFHSECPVSDLDDFAFVVFDPISCKVLDEDENHESYSKDHLARNLQRIGDRLPRFYSVTVEAVGSDKTVAQVGTVQLAENNKDKARERALSLLWESRLDAAGCVPKVQVEAMALS